MPKTTRDRPGAYYTHSWHLEKDALPRLGENLVAIKTEVCAASAPGVGNVVLTMLRDGRRTGASG